MPVGETDACLVPGCTHRAKDARAFCHDHWLELPNRMRRKISKLYSSSRRGHFNNPRQGVWNRTVQEAVAIIAPPQLPTPQPVVPVATTVTRARFATEPKEPEPEINPEAREAIQELNKPRTRSRRNIVHATEEIREDLKQRLSALSKEARDKIAKKSGLSITAVRDASTGRTVPSMATALAIQHALGSPNGVVDSDADTLWKDYLIDRFESGHSYPTPEEAFKAALELEEE